MKGMLTRPARRAVPTLARAYAPLGTPRLPPWARENEPFLTYPPDSADRKNLKEALARTRSQTVEIPVCIGGKEYFTGDVKDQRIPSDHGSSVAKFHQADGKLIQEAIANSLVAREKWANAPAVERMSVFLKAADLLTSTKPGGYRYDMMAAVMLGTGKTAWQGEIDAVWEAPDFLRMGVGFVEDMYNTQPPLGDPGVWNRVEYRPLEGFVVAISPFNFMAIGANLNAIPAMLGNVVLWKPASTAVLQNYLTWQIMREAGLPDGVINFCPASGRTISDNALMHRELAGIHFTGSTAVFRTIWQTIGNNIHNYNGYPRIVGETGGKNFHFVHESADIETVVNQSVRGAFEYQGQKCSATSRMYVPDTKWPAIKQGMLDKIATIQMGQPDDLTNFMAAVIDKTSFDNITAYIEHAKSDPSCTIITGGNTDDSTGYFVEPTIIETTDPHTKTMEEEIFGPVLTVCTYDANDFEGGLRICDATSPYALTGSIFAKDRYAIDTATKILQNACGNLYVNDKCTGAIVGQQPFGGARASGTCDKAGAGAIFNRFVAMRAIKENFLPLREIGYPHMVPDSKEKVAVAES